MPIETPLHLWLGDPLRLLRLLLAEEYNGPRPWVRKCTVRRAW